MARYRRADSAHHGSIGTCHAFALRIATPGVAPLANYGRANVSPRSTTAKKGSNHLFDVWRKTGKDDRHDMVDDLILSIVTFLSRPPCDIEIEPVSCNNLAWYDVI